MRLAGPDIACAVVVANAKKVTVVNWGHWGDLAGEHPLEALYQARDSVWRAVCAARRSDEISAADRVKCERIALDLIGALEELGTTCALRAAAPRARASHDPGREAWLACVVDDLGLDTQDH